MTKRKAFKIGSALTQGLQQTISAATNYSGELRYEVIPLYKIEMDPDNPRVLALTPSDITQGISDQDPKRSLKEKEKESLQNIAYSIQKKGVLNPIIVYRHEDNYRLVAGERRTLASYLAQKKDIKAQILERKPDNINLRLMQWIENVDREDLKLSERLRNLLMIFEAYIAQTGKALSAVTGTEISEVIGCSERQSRRYKLLMNASSELKKCIYADQITLVKAVFIASQDSSVQQQLINAVAKNVSLVELKQISKTTVAAPKNLPKTTKGRGRRSSKVNFGSTQNIKVAKIIMESIINGSDVKHLNLATGNVDWQDYESINQAIKHLIRSLEKTVTY